MKPSLSKTLHLMLYLCSGSLFTFILSVGCAPLFAQTTDPGEQAPHWIQPPDFQYTPAGKPDPFRPIIQASPPEPSSEGRGQKALTPLERIQPSQLKLVGILRQKDGQSRAMVELPNGKGYLLKVGVPIGQRQGKVTAITGSSVVIQESSTDVFGRKKTSDTILKLHKKAGESNG